MKSAERRWMWAALVSLAGWLLLQTLVPGKDITWTPAMLEAAGTMQDALDVTADHCRAKGIAVNAAADPNGTCLIGPELSELFTTAGQLEAKRTTTNPDVAGFIVHLLAEAGVTAGDEVAVAASGSFPALMVATLAAIEAIGARPSAILSLGASSWGATRPEFDLLDLQQLLLERGVLQTPVSAASLGGSGDTGREFEPDVRRRLRRTIEDRGITFLYEADLERNVAERMSIYGLPAAFVNVGGSEAAIGTSPEILKVRAGLHTDLADRLPLPPAGQRGVLFEMAAAGVPVVHLLHIRGLSLRFAVPWDPIPLPVAGTTLLQNDGPARGFWFWPLTIAYLGLLGVLALYRMERKAGAADAALEFTRRRS